MHAEEILLERMECELLKLELYDDKKRWSKQRCKCIPLGNTK